MIRQCKESGCKAAYAFVIDPSTDHLVVNHQCTVGPEAVNVIRFPIDEYTRQLDSFLDWAVEMQLKEAARETN